MVSGGVYLNQIVAAVCDSDEVYVNRFALYVKEHHAERIKVHGFTRMETLMEGLLMERFDVVLIGGGFDGAKEGIKQYHIPILFLEEEVGVGEEGADAGGSHAADVSSGLRCAAEENRYQQERVSSILKYQSAENIMHEIFRVCDREEKMPEIGLEAGGKIEWIGVCSPIQHEMQMPFAVTMASMLSEQRKVLYLNLTGCSGFLATFRLEGEHNLEDILVKIRQKRLTAQGFFRSVYQSETLFYIPPVTNPEHLYQMSREEYFLLLHFLEQETDFEAVVLDIGGVIPGFFEVLEHCSEVYAVMKNGPYPECRRAEFEDALQKGGLQKLAERIQNVYLPYSSTQVVPAMGLLEQFKWSELGDMARRYLFGGDGL